MAFTKDTDDYKYISGASPKGVPDTPSSDVWPASRLKAQFDLGVQTLSTYVNGLVAELESNGAESIGINTISGIDANTVQTALEKILETARGAQAGVLVAGTVVGAAVNGTGSAIKEGSIGARDIHDGEITTAKMASTFTVQGSQVQNLTVNKSQINNFSVALSELPSIPLGDEKVTGTLPPAKGGTGQTSLESARQAMNAAKVTTTTVSIPTTSWNNKTATVSVTGITSGGTVIVTAAPATRSYWVDADVYCSGQATDQLTFTCETVPTASVTANVMVIT